MPGRRTVHQNIGFANSNSDVTQAPVGGIVLPFKASGTLNVGDAVYFTANADEVTKSTTQANYVTFAGFVVGGTRNGMEAVAADLVPGAAIATLQAAQNGETVLVQITGVGIAISGAIIAPGQRVLAEGAGTAGRIVAGTTAGLMLGHTVSNATAANQWQKVYIALR